MLKVHSLSGTNANILTLLLMTHVCVSISFVFLHGYRVSVGKKEVYTRLNLFFLPQKEII